MGYRKIPNLYADQRILSFKTVWALEKIHGTSAHVAWDGVEEVRIDPGSESAADFWPILGVGLVDRFQAVFGEKPATVFGELHGGKIQGMRRLYGSQRRFVGFDVRVGPHCFLNAPVAAELCQRLGFEHVPMVETPTDLEALDRLRDAPSEHALRCGIEQPEPREGIVLRPPFEVRLNNGERLVAKHKAAAFSELRRPPRVGPKPPVLEQADEVAAQWVTTERVRHVLDQLRRGGRVVEVKDTLEVVTAALEDVLAESAGEIVDSREARRAIMREAGKAFRAVLDKDMRRETGR